MIYGTDVSTVKLFVPVMAWHGMYKIFVESFRLTGNVEDFPFVDI